MTIRIFAISFIFACTSVAWFILGTTVFTRTRESDSRLKGRVASLWGEPHQQLAPRAFYCKAEGEKTQAVQLPLTSSRLEARLDLDHRRKGLLWYSTYRVAFSGEYGFENDTDTAREVTLSVPLPAAKAVYDDLVFLVNGQVTPYTNRGGTVTATRALAPGESLRLRFGYRSQGLDRWRYSFGKEVSRVRDFQLKVLLNFRDMDFEDNTLAPTEKRAVPPGMELVWRFTNMYSGSEIAISMPEKLQPGPVAAEISFFAPVSLLFFFFVMFLVTNLRGIDLHPMNYFFLAAAFFAFHLLLAYLADHVSIHTAFLLSSAVSIFLVVSYLRLVTGIRFAAVEAGLTQFVYLVLFSYAFFFRGYTGLAVTVGAVLTLFVTMQMTGRIRWSERFAARPRPAPGVF